MGVNTDVLLRHYAVAGPLMERLFGAIPFVWTTLPRGFDGPKSADLGRCRRRRAQKGRSSTCRR